MKFPKKIRLSNSIRFYIILMVVLSGVIPSVLLSVTMMSSFRKEAIHSDMSNMLGRASILADQLSTENYLEDASIRTEDQLKLLGAFYDGRLLVVDSDYKVVYDTFYLDNDKTVISAAVFHALSGEEYTAYDSKSKVIGIAVPILASSGDGVNGALLVTFSVSDLSDTIGQVRKVLVFMVMGIVALILLLAVNGSRKLMQPFNEMSKSIDEMQMGYGENHLQVVNYVETKKMADAFNSMLARIKAVDDSRKDFVANVSHELKTPLASVKVLADSLVEQEDVPKEVYQDFMQDITKEIDRENNIINDLLSLVKMDQGQGALNIKSVNINEILEQTISRIRPLMDRRGIQLVYENLRPVTAEVDESKMMQVFTNLIENAVKYNKDNGWIHVTLNSDNQYFYLKVEDSGIGIPEESLDRVFDRFYRVDKSHSREIGGTGLGLSIVRNIVLLHRGAIQVDSTEGKGSTFSVRIPLNYADKDKEKDAAGNAGKGEHS